MEKKKCADCRNSECLRQRAITISMLESDPEYPWSDFEAPKAASPQPTVAA